MNRLHKQLMTTAAVLAFGGTAYAADMPVRAQPYAAPVPYSSWEGFFLGGHIGVARMNSTCDPIAYFGEYSCAYSENATRSNSDTGFLAGVQGGYNFQSGNFVYGAVADWSWTNLNHTITTSNANYGFQSKVDWLASIRGKMGLVVNDTDVYLTGGVAIGRLFAQDNAVDESGYGAFSGTKVGWVAGVGAEHKFNQHWSINAEFLYYDLGTVTGPSHYLDETYQNQYTFEVLEGRLGFNYHF